MVIELVYFDTGHIWDVLFAKVIIIELVSFILSIISNRIEKTILTNITLIIGIMGIIFLLTHSLYIKDYN